MWYSLIGFILSPACMLLTALFLAKGSHPYPGPHSTSAKWKVDLSGYNTPESRKSRERWEFAQSIAPGVVLRFGLLSLLPSIPCTVWFLLTASTIALPVCLIAQMAIIYYAFSSIEKRIRERFGA